MRVRFFRAAIIAAAASAFAGGAAHAGVAVWAEANTVKVAPDAAAPASTFVWDGERAALKAGRGEWESFQVVIRSDVGRLISFEVYDLEGLRGKIVGSTVSVFREVYVDTPAGRRADPLVPAAGHADAAAGENTVLWFDVFVPPGTYAGKYVGRLKFKWSGGELELPLELTVWDVELPRPRRCGLLADVSLADFPSEKYLNVLAEHGVAAGDVADSCAPGAGPPYDWSACDRRLDYYLDAEGLPFVFAPAPRGGGTPAFFAALDAHLAEKGWVGRLVVDLEPKGADARYAGEVRAAAPGLPLAFPDGLYGAWWGVADAAAKGAVTETSFGEGSAYRGRVAALRAQGKGVAYDGTALANRIVASAAETRVLPWALWRFGGSYARLRRPAEAGPGGEGPLVYDGAAYGSNLPVPSMRLKLLREGAEDYEYLAVLRAADLGGYADELAAAVVPAWGSVATPEALYRAREAAALAVVKVNWGQAMTANPVSGRAVDDENVPVAGAVVSAGPVAAVTDADGRYALAYAPRGATLTATAPGYEKAGAASAGGKGDFFLRRRLRRFLLNDANPKGKAEARGFAGAKVGRGLNAVGGFALTGTLKADKEGRWTFRPALSDWRTFGGLALELYNGGKAGVRASCRLEDGAGGTCAGDFLLAPGCWTTARLAGAEAATTCDLADVAEVTVAVEGAAGTEVRLGRVWLEAPAK